MILYDEQNMTYTLHTQNTTYQMKVWDYNVLLHTYYGPRLAGGDLSYPLRRRDRGFSPRLCQKTTVWGAPKPRFFMLTQKISGIVAGATPLRAEKTVLISGLSSNSLFL